jgi:hypothetical protein
MLRIYVFLFSDILFKPLKTKHILLYLNSQFTPCRKHFITVIKTNHFALYRAIVVVFSEINANHINELCGQNVQLLNVKPVGSSSDQ